MKFSDNVRLLHDMWEEEAKEEAPMGFVTHAPIFSRSLELEDINRRCIERFQQEDMMRFKEEHLDDILRKMKL